MVPLNGVDAWFTWRVAQPSEIQIHGPFGIQPRPNLTARADQLMQDKAAGR